MGFYARRTQSLILLIGVAAVAGIAVVGARLRPSPRWRLADVPAPWGDRRALFEKIRQRVADPARASGGAGRANDLSDPTRVADDTDPDEAPGARDGYYVYEEVGRQDLAFARTIVSDLRAVARAATPQTIASLYQRLLERDAIEYVEALVDTLDQDDRLDPQRMSELAVWLATRAPDREPVKIAIAILGLYAEDTPANRALFETLAAHDEFTLYAVIGLGALLGDDGDDELWRVAARVTGWGRIHAVERLADAEDERIQNWLLREGYRNTVGYEYTALTCAHAGQLLGALEQEQVEPETLRAAGELITALVEGYGVTSAIDEYEDGARVLERYVEIIEHAPAASLTVDELAAIAVLESFLADESVNLSTFTAPGWSSAFRQPLERRCAALRNRATWHNVLRRALASEDSEERERAARVLEQLNASPAKPAP